MGTYLPIPTASTPFRPNTANNQFHPSSSHSPMLLHLPTLPTWDCMMHSTYMMHRSVEHSLGRREAREHCHSLTDRWVWDSELRFRPESRRPSLDPALLSAWTPSLPSPAQMQLLYLLLPQRCRTHSTHLCPPVATKHLTLTLSILLSLCFFSASSPFDIAALSWSKITIS